MQYVYMVQFDWSTTDAESVETFLYADYDDAYNKFKNLITDECDADVSWVGSEVFDEDGEVNEDYEVDCDDNNSGDSDVYWHIVDKNDYNRHSFIDLTKKEILGGTL